MKKETKDLNKKWQKGITLVALVVTIVVLIILATISVNIIFGEEGILEKAKQAKQDMTNAQKEEEQILADASNSIDGYIVSERESSNKESVLLEREYSAASLALPAAKWTTLEDISLAEYGTGKAIISYSANSSTGSSNNFDIAIYKVQNELSKNISEDRCATSSSITWLACSASATISYDENTVISFRAYTAAALTPIYTYSILIMPD